MLRMITLLSLLALAGCIVSPSDDPYGGFGAGYAPAAGNYNPISGSVTGSG
jgi:hypothetical protein